MDRYQFERKLFRLRKNILDGISYFIVWQALNREYEKEIHSKDKGFWWQYRGFFAPSCNALLWSTLMQLSKAYDTDYRAVSLNNLIVDARNNPIELAPYSTQNGLENIQVRIAQNITLLQKLRQYRNKRLVHYDSTETQNIEIPADDVNMLIEETKLIFNLLKHACEGDADNFEEIMADVSLHTSQVIDTMIKCESQG